MVAKNEGARAAHGDWVIILDSDDELLAGAATAIPNVAAAHPNAPLLFFRCEDEAGRLMEPRASPGPLPFSALVVGTLGQHCPVIKRTAFLACPYDEDLRGFVSLAYFRMVQRFGPAIISDAVVRRYYTVGEDRLCKLANRLGRADAMARGFSRWLNEFGQMLPWRRRMASAFPVGLLPAGRKLAAYHHPPFDKQQKRRIRSGRKHLVPGRMRNR